MASFKNITSTITKLFLTLVVIVCIALDVGALYIHFFGKSKAISTTVEISDMTVSRDNPETGDTIIETKTFLEVNVFDNAIEIRFNDLLDETESYFFSQGVQLIVKNLSTITGITKNSKELLNGTYGSVLKQSLVSETQTEDEIFFNKFKSEYNQVVTDKTYTNLNLYEYQSADNFETPLLSNLLQSSDTMFKLQAKDGESTKVLGVKFKQYDTKKNGLGVETLDVSNMTYVQQDYKLETKYSGLFNAIENEYITYTNVYRAFDIYYLIEFIANSISGLTDGFTGETYLKLPDIFDFYKFDGDAYIEVGTEDNKFIGVNAQEISFYKMKITVNSGNLESSNQSLFNMYKNTQNYNANPDYIDMTDYLTGRSLLTATLDDLDWNSTESTGVYTFALSNSWRTKWKEFKSTSFVLVVIDTDYLNSCNITYDGFDLTSQDDFIIYQIITEDGEILYKGVNYA